MLIVPPPSVTLTSANHRFFDDVVTAIGSQAALTAGYLNHAGHPGYRFLEDGAMRLGCLTQRDGNSILEIDVKPASILTALTQRSWPDSLDLKFEIVTECGTSGRSPLPPVTSPLIGMRRIDAATIEHAFLAYHDRCEDEIDAARSRAGRGSLPTLAFARTIRNAFAHGGMVHIDPRKSSTPGNWHGLNYSIADNGRQVMYQDMSHGDVILLMMEMDDLF